MVSISSHCFLKNLTDSPKPSSNGPSQPNVRDLDKSDAPFSILIDQACELLHIQLENDSITLLYDNYGLRIQPVLDLRIDRTLRWLLKNLQATEVRSGRYNIASWLWGDRIGKS